MSEATMTREPAPDVAPDASRLVVDCKHGQTVATLLPGATAIAPVTIARLALARHFDTERCACTRRLRRRYGVR